MISKKKKAATGVLCTCAAAVVLVCGVMAGLGLWKSGPQSTGSVVNSAAPTQAEDTAPAQETDPVASPVDLRAWTEINSDIFGWITLPDTKIDYPVLQNAEEDAYYLTHHFDKTANSFGSIFSEATYNHKGFSDRVTMLYGHDVWTEGLYFHPLHNFSDDTFFQQHNIVYTYTENERQTWEVLAWVVLDDRHIMYEFSNFADAEDVSNFFTLAQSFEDGIIRGGAWPEVLDESQYLFLSTCHPELPDRRCILVCELSARQPASYQGKGIQPEDLSR